MQEKLQQRLNSLKSEYEAGQKMMVELDTKQATLRDTLLRISGAIQVLEEALSDNEPITHSGDAASKQSVVDTPDSEFQA